MDWTAERVNSKWTFREVEFPSFIELGDYDFITGGNGSLSSANEYKATGSLEVDGGLPNEVNMLRVYYSCDNVLGESSGLIPVATYFPSVPEPTSRATSNGQRVSGQVNCVSTLSVLKDRLLDEELPIPKGSDVIEICRGLIEECLLPYEIRSTSDYRKGRDNKYDEGTSYLEVINDLLDLADFRAVYPNEYGTIIVEPRSDLMKGESVFTFERGENAIHQRLIPFSKNYRDTPTTIIGSYSAETFKIISTITNIDPNSPSSIVNRGNRRKDEYHQIDELNGSTEAEQIADAERRTLSILKSNSQDITHYELSHLFVPQVRPNRVITIKDQGVDFAGAVTNVTINFGTNAMCTTKARSVVKYELLTEAHTELYGLWQAGSGE